MTINEFLAELRKTKSSYTWTMVGQLIRANWVGANAAMCPITAVHRRMTGMIADTAQYEQCGLRMGLSKADATLIARAADGDALSDTLHTSLSSMRLKLLDALDIA